MYNLLYTGSQAGLDFYVGAMRNFGGQTTSYEFYITTLSTTDVSYTIEQMSGIITTGTVCILYKIIINLKLNYEAL